MSERCPICGNTDRPLFGALYIQAFGIANKNNQTIGECNDLYVTLEQIHSIMLRIAEEENNASAKRQ